MTEKELRRMSRAELLELLLAQAKENEKLKRRLNEVEAALASRRIAMEEAGTLAEAACKISGIFEAADQAAKIYLDNIHRQVKKSCDES